MLACQYNMCVHPCVQLEMKLSKYSCICLFLLVLFSVGIKHYNSNKQKAIHHPHLSVLKSIPAATTHTHENNIKMIIGRWKILEAVQLQKKQLCLQAVNMLSLSAFLHNYVHSHAIACVCFLQVEMPLKKLQETQKEKAETNARYHSTKSL